MTDKYELTPEHEAQFKPWCTKWVDVALDTTPMTKEDKEILLTAVRGLYTAAGYTPPPKEKILFMPSPMSAAIAGSLSAAYCVLRDNPSRHSEFFSEAITDAMVGTAMRQVVKQIIKKGTSRLAEGPAEDIEAYDSIINTIESLTGINVRTSRGKSLESLKDFFIAGASQWNHMYAPGNLWASWACFLSFFKEVIELPVDYTNWDHYINTARHGGPRIMHNEFCLVSDRPEILKHDAERRPHNEEGPSHRWRDGWEVYHHHGVKVPKAWIRDKENLDPTTALQWDNLEQRRAAAEIIGWERVLEKLNPTVVDQDKDPLIGTLLRADLPDSPRQQFLKVQCGTGRTFVLCVPPEMQTALEANSWSFPGLSPKELLKLETRT